MSLIDPAPTRLVNMPIKAPNISARDDAARESAARLSRRGFLLRSVGLVGFFGASTAGYATAIEPERLVTTTYRITPPGWRSGRLTVVGIADLHAGGANMTLAHI